MDKIPVGWSCVLTSSPPQLTKTKAMILTALIFIVSGILIKNFKMYNLLAGYNSMPKEEKAKYDIERIAMAIKHIMFGMALVIFAGIAIGNWMENEKLQYYIFAISLSIGIPLLLFIANSKKYKRKD